MKSYIVTGPRKVLGHEPGAEFEAEIPEAQEQRLLSKGALREAEGDPATDALSDLSREELNVLAAEAGIEGAESLPNKAEVAKAINAANQPDASGNTQKEE